LTKVRWIITTPATVGGNPKITNNSTTTAQTPTASQLSYSFSLSPTFLGSPLAGGTQTASTLSCTAGSCTNSIGVASEVDGEVQGVSKTFTVAGTYTGNSVFASLNPLQVAAFTSGTVASTYEALFAGGGTALGWDFNVAPGTVGTGANQRPTVTPFINGSVALEYEYQVPAGAIVPGPVPLIGAAAAFGWSRRLKKRIASVA
jgi:hypothetical protein